MYPTSHSSQSDETITSQILAVVDSTRNFPDVIDFKDFRKRSKVAIEAVRMVLPDPYSKPSVVHLPKKSANEYRKILVQKPIDEICGRLVLRGGAEYAGARLPQSVLAMRPEISAGGWRIRNYREALKEQTEIERRYRDQEQGGGVGIVDVRNHFPSIDLYHLGKVCNSVGMPSVVVESIVAHLRKLQELTDIDGLPIGPDISALLGTLVLLPVDRCFKRFGCAYHRWVDDMFFYPESRSAFEDVVSQVGNQLELSGQQLNPSKTSFETWGGPTSSGRPSGMFAAFGSESGDSEEAPSGYDYESLNREFFREWSDKYVRLITDDINVAMRLPKSSTQYLSRHLEDDRVQQFIIDAMNFDSSHYNEMLQVRLARLQRKLAQRYVSIGRSFFGKAEELPSVGHDPLRASCYATYAVSDAPFAEHKNQVLGIVDALNSTNIRRGLLWGLVDRPQGLSRTEKGFVKNLASQDPNLMPVSELLQ